MFLYWLRIQKLNKCTCNVFCSGVGKNREQKEILTKWHNWWRFRWIPNYQGWTFTFFCIFKIFCFFCSMKGLGCLNKRRCGRRLNYWGWTCSFFLFQILDFVYFWTFVKNKRRCGVGGDWTAEAEHAVLVSRPNNLDPKTDSGNRFWSWSGNRLLFIIEGQNNWQALDRESGLQSLNM